LARAAFRSEGVTTVRGDREREDLAEASAASASNDSIDMIVTAATWRRETDDIRILQDFVLRPSYDV
jgi:hypothetical protein